MDPTKAAFLAVVIMGGGIMLLVALGMILDYKQAVRGVGHSTSYDECGGEVDLSLDQKPLNKGD